MEHEGAHSFIVHTRAGQQVGLSHAGAWRAFDKELLSKNCIIQKKLYGYINIALVKKYN